MNNESMGGPMAGAGDLEKAAAAIRASAGSAAPSPKAVHALLDALRAAEQAPRRETVSSGRGGLSLSEDSLMKKWRFHDAFRPLSFESLERRRLLAAFTCYQDDSATERRGAWPDSFFPPAIHVRGDRPQRRWDGRVRPEASAVEQVDAQWLTHVPFATRASAELFGSELIPAA